MSYPPCHGPGGDHIKDGGKRPGGILKLADRCDSCVIWQICGAFHDGANDPEFCFELADKINAPRHGTAREVEAAKTRHGS